MAAETFYENLQPSLLDRLTDNNPDVKVESGKRGFSAREIRNYVQRDLAWLLNSGYLEDVVDLSEHPYVAKSVLNFGIPDLTGRTVSNTDTQLLQRQLRKILLHYEPRIIAETLKINVTTTDQMSGNALSFEIDCNIWSDPVPEHLYLKSTIDLEAGRFCFDSQ